MQENLLFEITTEATTDKNKSGAKKLKAKIDFSPTDFEKLLSDKFALSKFRPGQLDIITTVLNGGDAIAVLPTGGGKSLCYQYPSVFMDKLVVVISPLIALMKDQVASLEKKGIAAGCLFSGQTDDERRAVFSNIGKGGGFVLYLSPERVQKEGFQKWIMGRDIGLFAVDEAHCVSQWGHDFREEYSQLKVLKELRPDVPLLALTASATPTVLSEIGRILKLKKPKQMVHGFYRNNLYYQVENCADENEKLKFLFQAIKQNPVGRVLVYCGTRKTTEEIAFQLNSHFEDVAYYHAGMNTADRTQVQKGFETGKYRILVATNAFGMGIDRPDVRLVVHNQLPANIDSLYQEMGRAGRDGEFSTCLLLYAKKDKGLQSFFIQSSDAPAKIKSARFNNLDILIDYAEGSECRHAEILTYYRDSQRIGRCGHCDNCDPTSHLKVQKPSDIFETESTLASTPEKLQLTRSPKKKKSSAAIILNPLEETRFQSLRTWRKGKALELDLPAFVIFSDRTLRELAQKNPQSLEELKSIHGIGEQKLEKFGWDLLAELAN